jgi:hypothetical protein
MYFAEVLQINSLVQLNGFYGCTKIVWGPFVIRDVKQVSASPAVQLSVEIIQPVLADKLIHLKFIFLCAVRHDFLTPP